MNRLWRRGLIGLGLLGLAGLLAVGLEYRRFTHTPLHWQPTGGAIEIPRDRHFSAIVARLRAAGVSDYKLGYWWLLAKRMRVSGRLHAGEYALTPGMRPYDLLQAMAAGKVLQHRLTLVEGWTFQTLRLVLALAPSLRHPGAELSEAELMRRLGAAGVAPEGQFMPATYVYVWGESDLDILRRAYQDQQRLLARLWAERAPQLPLTRPQQALTLASIVEKETARGDERAKIAGVFIRRLRIGMPLQTDPTVIYALGARYLGHLYRADLSYDSAYNTYLHPGLPPTPIAMPGRAALLASLHPELGDALYFVARGDGRHAFARSLAEQSRHIACYRWKRCP